MRAETGPMEFEDDWRGVFIRGDNAFYYAQALESLLNTTDKDNISSIFNRAAVESLISTLRNSHQHVDTDVQLMLPFEECVKCKQ